MPLVKILIVTDDDGGYQRSTSASHKFHLGEFVKVLNDTDWDGFTIQITRAHRSADPSPATPQPTHPIGAELYGFRFSATSLSGFDMVLFFSIASKGEDPVSSDASRQAEAAAVAAFMEAGGGFFAAGDHEDLGASINQHIPRVRSMRRWAHPSTGPHSGAVAPTGTEADRHDTLQPGSDSGTLMGTTYAYQFNDQSDALPQTIDTKSYVVSKSKYFLATLPHPLLCCPLGRINVLPDHMHEGWCEVPSNLSLDEGLPGRTGKKEYPSDGDGVQVEPEVVAEATVLAHATLNQEFAGSSFAVSPATTGAPYSFGVIAAYDGHRANVGRVVVDATWHHFVNINVIGTSFSTSGLNPAKAKGFYNGPGDTPNADYERIMWYFRNLVYWLIPASRTTLIIASWAAAVMRHPNWEQFKTLRWRTDLSPAVAFTRLIHFAQLAEDYFAGVRGHCLKYQLLPIILYPIKKLFPWEIWQEILPEIAPWEAREIDWEPQPAWRQAVLPDANLLRQALLGTVVLAATEIVGRYDEMTEKQLQKIQARTLELLPQHLRLVGNQIEAGARDARNLANRFAKLAEGLSTKAKEPAIA